MLRTYTIEECGDYGVIYCLTSPSGKCYIGQSWSIKARFGKYKNLSDAIKRQPKLYNALKKYNPINFKYEIIDICQSIEEMDNKEAFYIELYDSMDYGYNAISGGKSTGKLSIETRKNISIGKLKYFKNHDNNRKGQTHTQESKNKISETKKRNFASGKVIHNWTGKKLSKNLIKKRMDTKLKNGKLSYYKIITPTNEIIIIRCLMKFCKINGIKYGTMISSMDPKRNTLPPNGFIGKKITLEEVNILQGYILHEYDYPF